MKTDETVFFIPLTISPLGGLFGSNRLRKRGKCGILPHSDFLLLGTTPGLTLAFSLYILHGMARFGCQPPAYPAECRVLAGCIAFICPSERTAILC